MKCLIALFILTRNFCLHAFTHFYPTLEKMGEPGVIMLNLLDFTQEASNCYEDSRRQKIRIGTRYLRIAATALSVNGIVVTRNRKDFIKVPNLMIEDWTVN